MAAACGARSNRPRKLERGPSSPASRTRKAAGVVSARSSLRAWVSPSPASRSRRTRRPPVKRQRRGLVGEADGILLQLRRRQLGDAKGVPDIAGQAGDELDRPLAHQPLVGAVEEDGSDARLGRSQEAPEIPRRDLHQGLGGAGCGAATCGWDRKVASRLAMSSARLWAPRRLASSAETTEA